MAITVVANPANLTWANFTPSGTQILDPGDGTLVDAFTRFNFDLPPLPPREINGQFAMADPNVITITPNAQVFTGVLQTPALLSHEQFHYDVGIVTARALARQLMALRAPNQGALVTAVQSAARLHFITRAGILQRRYDLDTRHGTNAHFQKIWKDRMVTCLANPRSDQLGGFFL
ncbi:MAG TPA: DUF922 domain-containing protein [Blastocatellia bacterium]|jgi:hypothetical protein|nr:DUF922 domain-containing protein [Blastocatellia bacterium]